MIVTKENHVVSLKRNDNVVKGRNISIKCLIGKNNTNFEKHGV